MTSGSLVSWDVPHCPHLQLLDVHPELSPVLGQWVFAQGGPEALSTSGGALPGCFLHHPQLPGVLLGPSEYGLLLHRQVGRVAVSSVQAGG